MEDEENSLPSSGLLTQDDEELKLWQEPWQESQSSQSKSSVSKHSCSGVVINLWQDSVKTPSSNDSGSYSEDDDEGSNDSSQFIEYLKVEVPKEVEVVKVVASPVKSVRFKSPIKEKSPPRRSPVKSVKVKRSSPKRSPVKVKSDKKYYVPKLPHEIAPSCIKRPPEISTSSFKHPPEIDNDPNNPKNDPNSELFAGDPGYCYVVLPENNPKSDEFRVKALPLKLPKNYKRKLPVDSIEYRYTEMGQFIPDYDERGYKFIRAGLGSKFWTPSVIGDSVKLDRLCAKAKKKEEQDIYKQARTPIKITPMKEQRHAKNDNEMLLSHFGGKLLASDIPTWNQNSVWKNTMATCPLGITEKCDVCIKLLFSEKLRSKPYKNLAWFEDKDSTSPYYAGDNSSIRHSLVKNMLPKEIRLRSISRKAVFEALLTRFRGYAFSFDLQDVIDEIFEYKHWRTLGEFLKWKQEWDHKFELEDYGSDNTNYYCTGCGVKCTGFYNSVGERVQKCRTGFCEFLHNESFKSARVKGKK